MLVELRFDEQTPFLPTVALLQVLCTVFPGDGFKRSQTRVEYTGPAHLGPAILGFVAKLQATPGSLIVQKKLR